jgi:hypothetical protein
VLANLIAFLHKLPDTKAWKVEVVEYHKRRSHEQNAYLWGVCYETLRKSTGQESEDWHEYFLGEYFGWEETELFGRRKLKPKRRSSKLSTVEFGGFVDFIMQKAAENGIYIESPTEELRAA